MHCSHTAQARRRCVSLLTVSKEAETSVARIRVVVAEDGFLAREAIEQILGRAPEVDVVAVCEDRTSLLEAIDAQRPAVVVTDIRMPPTKTDEGIQVARALREEHPEMGVVVVSQFVEPSYALSLLESGSSG